MLRKTLATFEQNLSTKYFMGILSLDTLRRFATVTAKISSMWELVHIQFVGSTFHKELDCAIKRGVTMLYKPVCIIKNLKKGGFSGFLQNLWSLSKLISRLESMVTPVFYFIFWTVRAYPVFRQNLDASWRWINFSGICVRFGENGRYCSEFLLNL